MLASEPLSSDISTHGPYSTITKGEVSCSRPNQGLCLILGISFWRPLLRVRILRRQHKQYACKRWHEERFARLTLSKFGEICKSRLLVKMCTRMLYTKIYIDIECFILIFAMGRDHKSCARDKYMKILEQGWAVYVLLMVTVQGNCPPEL